MTCQVCREVQRQNVLQEIALDRERRVNDRLVGLALLAEMLLDVSTMTDTEKMFLLRKQAQHFRDAAQFTLDERTGRKRTA